MEADGSASHLANLTAGHILDLPAAALLEEINIFNMAAGEVPLTLHNYKSKTWEDTALYKRKIDSVIKGREEL